MKTSLLATFLLLISIVQEPIVGRYHSKRKYDIVELELKENHTYIQEWHSCTFHFRAQGKWETIDDTLYLDIEQVDGSPLSELSDYVKSRASKYVVKTDTLYTVFGSPINERIWLPLVKSESKK